MKGLTTKSEIEILMGFGAENFTVYLQREEVSQKWCIQVSTKEGKLYFIERQKGGMRTFAHLEDALRTARRKFGKLRNLEIYYDGMKLTLEHDNGPTQQQDTFDEE